MRNLFTHNIPTAYMERVKQAKLRILGDELVQPHKAVPGTPGRILAYGDMPPFACDYALITERTSDAGLEAALKHVLGIQDHVKGVGMAEWLSKVMGAQVVEVEDGLPAFR